MATLTHTAVPRAESKQARAALSGLVPWGFFNLLPAAIVPAFPTLYLGALGSVMRFFFASSLLWLLAAAPTIKTRFAFPKPLLFLLVLQVWLGITTFYSASKYGGTDGFNSLDYAFLAFIIVALQAQGLAIVSQKACRGLINVIIGLVVISDFVAVLQFVRFGPAIRIVEYYTVSGNITDWNGVGGVRAIGLFGAPHVAGIMNLLAFGIVASRVFIRSLSWKEFLFCGLCLVCALIPQGRTIYPWVGICALILVFMLIRQDPSRSILYTMTLALSIFGLFIFGARRLAYALSTRSVLHSASVSYRYDVAWKRAIKVAENHPFTGIGTNETYMSGSLIPGLDTGRHDSEYVLDGGYLLLIVFGGYPAIALYISFLCATAIYLFYRARALHGDPWPFSFAMTALLYVLMTVTTAYLSNMIMLFNIISPMFMVIGFAAGVAVTDSTAKPAPKAIARLRSRASKVA